MNKLLKTALTLVATGGFAISGVTPVAAEANKFTSTIRLPPPRSYIKICCLSPAIYP